MTTEEFTDSPQPTSQERSEPPGWGVWWLCRLLVPALLAWIPSAIPGLAETRALDTVVETSISRVEPLNGTQCRTLGEISPNVQPCPFDGNSFHCSVSIGPGEFTIRGTSLEGGELEITMWDVGGVSQLNTQLIFLKSLVDNSTPDFILESAVVDESAANPQIQFQFVNSTGAVRAYANFVFDALLGPSFSLINFAEFFCLEDLIGVEQPGRLYVYSDMELNGDPLDAGAEFSSDESDPQALQYMQHDAVGNTRYFVVFGLPVPDHYEIGDDGEVLDCLLANSGQNSLCDLSTPTSTGTNVGPGDLEVAFSWDFTIPAQGFFSTGLAQLGCFGCDFLLTPFLDPYHGSAGVSPGTSLRAIYPEELDPSTVGQDAIVLRKVVSGEGVPGVVTLDSTVLTFTPSALLQVDTLYEAILSDSMMTLSGSTVPTDFPWQFSTGGGEHPLQDELSSDTGIPQSEAQNGTVVARGGNLDGDAAGTNDLLVGAPGFEIGQAGPEVGAVLVYLGCDSATPSECDPNTPDIVFTGVEAHDRTGVDVAGDFDFNGDGFPDILIGAEQVNRSGIDDPECDDGAPCGNGVAYLIFFDPDDYPNIGDPDAIDIIDLSGVGTTIPGVVFTGESLGDRAGFAVTGGGQFNSPTGRDIAIGAPGRNGDAGTVYVVYSDQALPAAVGLEEVTSAVSGRVFEGGAAGDELGAAVAFPGNVAGGTQDEIAMGAPGAIATDGPAVGTAVGIVYLTEIDDEIKDDVIDVCAIGISEDGTQVQGSETGEMLGYSVSTGRDNLVDGADDLLIGAPGYSISAGRVLQTTGALPGGVVTADQVGVDQANPIEGRVWAGSGFGDQLGFDVAALGDVTGDGTDDIALGAPFSDIGATDGGAVYIVEGATGGPFLAVDPVISVSEIGGSVPGLVYVGTQPGQNVGASIAGLGDVDNDGNGDVGIGAPETSNGNGAVYVVTDAGSPEFLPCPDGDGDGFFVCLPSCIPPTQGACGDCDDGSPTTFPGAAVNESPPDACLRDADGDGFGATSPPPGVPTGTDCDDEDVTSFPAASEVCDGNDNDCDGVVPTEEQDLDGDQFVVCDPWHDVQGDQSDVLGGGDCDDGDPGVALDCECAGTVVTLHPGWNFTGVVSDVDTDAEGVCQQAVAIDEIERWTPTGWQGYSCGAQRESFSIDALVGYFLRSQGQSTWCQQGRSIGCDSSVSLRRGWNPISLPPGVGDLRASDLCTQLSPGDPSEIARWIDGGWDSFVCESSINDFRVDPARGYLTRLRHPTDWSIECGEPSGVRAVPPAFPASVGSGAISAGPFVANQTDVAFTVVWETSEPAAGWIELTDGSEEPQVIYDVRGPQTVSRVHYVQVSGLRPSTSYDVAFGPEGSESLTTTTGPTLELSLPLPRQGRFSTSVNDLVLLVRRANADDGDPWLASLVEDGEWFINLGNLRTEGLGALEQVGQRTRLRRMVLGDDQEDPTQSIRQPRSVRSVERVVVPEPGR